MDEIETELVAIARRYHCAAHEVAEKSYVPDGITPEEVERWKASWFEHRRRGDERNRAGLAAGPYASRAVPEVAKGSKRDKMRAADAVKSVEPKNLWRKRPSG